MRPLLVSTPRDGNCTSWVASADLPTTANCIDFFRCSSIFFCFFLSPDPGVSTWVVDFKRGAEEFTNSFSLPGMRAGLPWLAGGSLGDRFFAGYARASIGARIGSRFGCEIQHGKRRQPANGLGVRSGIWKKGHE